MIISIIIAIELAILIYLDFKRLPKETQKEVLRKVEPIRSKTIEWVPEESEEVLAERKIRENL